MKNLGKIILLGLSLICGSLPCVAEDNAEGWILAKDKNGIKIFTRHIEGSEIKEFQATVKIKTNMNSALALYQDPSKCADWVPDCMKSEILEKVSDSKFFSYTQIHNPWPFQNRDYALEHDVIKNSATGETLIEFKDVKERVSENKCCVRMNMVKGFWKFTQTQDGYLDVTYRYHFHPGGKIPVSAINAALPDLPMETLTKMRKILENAGQ